MNKTLKRTIIVLLSAITGILFVFAGYFLFPRQESVSVRAEVVVECASLKDEPYIVGELLTIDAQTITVNGKEYVLKSTKLIKPDGSVGCSDRYKLNATGNYTVIFVCDDNGTEKEFEKQITVTSTAFVMSSGDSNVVIDDAQKYSGSGDTANVVTLNVAAEDAITFNQEIQLNDNRQSMVKFNVFPKLTASKQDGQFCTFRFTDLYDKNVYVDYEVYYRRETSGTINVVTRAKYSGSDVSVGFRQNPSLGTSSAKQIYMPDYDAMPEFNYNNYWRADVNTLGTPVGSVSNGQQTLNLTLELLYDNENQIVALNYLNNNGRETLRLINDFNVKNYGFNTKDFPGFKSGAVVLSVLCGDLEPNMKTVPVEVVEIGGLSVCDNYNLDYFEDKVAPQINLEIVEGYEIELGRTFKIPEVEVSDNFCESKDVVVKKSVFYNYGKPEQYMLGLINGCFIPTEYGDYTIVYQATDVYGNVSSRKVKLTCTDTPSLYFSTTKIATASLNAGQTITLPEYTFSAIEGNSGISIYAICNDEKTEIDIDTRQFTPMQVGTYKIVYEYYDVYQTVTYSYEIESVSSNYVAFQPMTMPKYVMKNAAYSFEQGYGYSFKNGTPLLEKSELTMRKDGVGEFVKVDITNVTINGCNSYVEFRQELNGNVSNVYKIPVIDVGIGSDSGLDLMAYFSASSGEFTKGRSALGTSLTTASADNEIMFINPISLKNFKLEFFIDSLANYSGVEIALIDYVDHSIIQPVKVVKGTVGNTIELSTKKNANKPVVLSENLGNSSIKTIGYDAGRNRLYYGDTLIDLDVAFKSEKVYLSIRLVGVEGSSTVNVKMINNQTFIHKVSGGGEFLKQVDGYTPEISYSASTGQYQPDSIIDICTPTYADVLSTILDKDVSFSVRDPEGNFMTSVDGVLLNGKQDFKKNYQIKATVYGDYFVTYNVKDSSGKSARSIYVFSIVDMTSPVIELENGYNSQTRLTVKLGDVVKVAGYTVSDNVDAAEDLNVSVHLFDPNKAQVNLKGYTAFKANYVGEYQIMYFVYDKAGNYNAVYYTIVVTQ